VVHTDAVIDTRAQKMVSHKQRITESVFACDQHCEEQNTLTTFLTFLCLWMRIFYSTIQKQYNSPTTTAFGLHHAGALNNSEMKDL